jgi:hypothetical protein
VASSTPSPRSAGAIAAGGGNLDAIFMARLSNVTIAVVLACLGACGRNALLPAGEDGGQGGAGGGGRGGSGGSTVVLRLPDGGLSALLGDSGVLGGILDAPRDSMIGQIICGPEAKLGAQCSTDQPVCLLPSLGGACYCANGNYLCPLDPTAGPQACPKGATSGASCVNPLAVCIGGGANACICTGTYMCF